MNEKMKDDQIGIIKKIKKTTPVYLSIFLAVIMLISLYINFSSFKNQFITNELSFHSISASRVVDRIEYGLLYGKSLDNFYGMDKMINEWCDNNDQAVNVTVLSKDQKETYYQMAEASSYKGMKVNDSIMLEINDSNGDLCGYLNVAVNLNEKLKDLGHNMISFFMGTGILLLLGIAAILIFCRLGNFVTGDFRIEKKKILIFMLLLILILQTAFTTYSYVVLKNSYIEISNNTGREIKALVQADIDKVIEQGVAYEQIHDFEDYAKDVIKKAPLVEDISLRGDQLNVELNVEVSKVYIDKALKKMLVDMATVLVTSMFIAAEIVNYMMISINRRIKKISGVTAEDKLLRVRVSSFLIHVACYLPISFIPIMMNDFTGGTASDFVLGLPIVINFAAGFIFTLLAGNWSIKVGWKKLLMAGGILVIASSLLAGLIPNPIVLIIARGLYGAAYALIYVSIREFAANTTDRQERSKGLAQVTAGLYAGINIGAVLGSIIFESVGFLGVFLISAIIGFLAIIVMKKYCVEDGPEKRSETEDDLVLETIKEKDKTAGMLSIIKNWDMIRLAVFIIAPLAISGLYFEYFLPVYALKADIAAGDIGRAFLVNGIAIAYIAPMIVKYFAGRVNEKLSLFLFTVLMGLGFFVFGIWGGVISILAASAIMGVAEGTALVSQNMVMLDLDVAKKAGTSRTLSMYATIRKLSQTAGPQIFAAFMLIGYQFGMLIFGAVIIACSCMYIWSGWVGRGVKNNG